MTPIIQNMKRTNFYLPESQLDELRALSSETGAPMSELVRRAINMYLESKNGKVKMQD